MLPLYFVQQWFNLSDLSVEKRRCMGAAAVRRAVGVHLGIAAAPHETTIRLRHLLETDELVGVMLDLPVTTS